MMKKKRNNKSSHELYNIWRGMVNRKNKKKDVKVCEAWINSFDKFISDMGIPKVKSRLKRKNLHRNFDEDNCYWKEVVIKEGESDTIFISTKVSRVRDVVKKDNTFPTLF